MHEQSLTTEETGLQLHWDYRVIVFRENSPRTRYNSGCNQRTSLRLANTERRVQELEPFVYFARLFQTLHDQQHRRNRPGHSL